MGITKYHHRIRPILPTPAHNGLDSVNFRRKAKTDETGGRYYQKISSIHIAVEF